VRERLAGLVNRDSAWVFAVFFAGGLVLSVLTIVVGGYGFIIVVSAISGQTDDLVNGVEVLGVLALIQLKIQILPQFLAACVAYIGVAWFGSLRLWIPLAVVPVSALVASSQTQWQFHGSFGDPQYFWGTLWYVPFQIVVSLVCWWFVRGIGRGDSADTQIRAAKAAGR
jgi:hypothetical protein